MDFERIQQVSDIRLDGIKVEVERRDGAIIALTLRDSAGHTLRIASGSTYDGVQVLVPAAPKQILRHFVTGVRKDGSRVEERFNDYYAANTRRDQLVGMGADVTVEAREVGAFQE